MHSDFFEPKTPPTYKSYKAEKINKNINRQMALVTGVLDSSLNDADKIALLKSMIGVIESIIKVK